MQGTAQVVSRAVSSAWEASMTLAELMQPLIWNGKREETWPNQENQSMIKQRMCPREQYSAGSPSAFLVLDDQLDH